jgi:hypothetical protein
MHACLSCSCNRFLIIAIPHQYACAHACSFWTPPSASLTLTVPSAGDGHHNQRRLKMSQRRLKTAGERTTILTSPIFTDPTSHRITSRKGPRNFLFGDQSVIAKTTRANAPLNLPSSSARNDRAVSSGSLRNAPHPHAPSTRLR